MTGWGKKIPDLSVQDLQEKLRATDDDGKAVKRLVTALAYKQGLSPAGIEHRYGIPSKKVYLWLDRFEERGLEDALSDDPKPGRPSKLSDDQRARLEAALRDPPAAAGYDAQRWTPPLVQELIESRFDVEYTRRHVRRLIADLQGAGPRTDGEPERTEADSTR